MTPKLQNITIAAFCGWAYANFNWFLNGEYSNHAPPDYVADLNAMHSAEQALLSTEQQNAYYANIAEITWGNEETGNRQVVFNQLTATAAQRAEAFLKTLGMWEEVSE
jgi:hypothetical protein